MPDQETINMKLIEGLARLEEGQKALATDASLERVEGKIDSVSLKLDLHIAEEDRTREQKAQRWYLGWIPVIVAVGAGIISVIALFKK